MLDMFLTMLAYWFFALMGFVFGVFWAGARRGDERGRWDD